MARLSQYLEPKAPKATEIKSQTKLAWFSQYLDPKAPKTTEIKSKPNAKFIKKLKAAKMLKNDDIYNKHLNQFINIYNCCFKSSQNFQKIRNFVTISLTQKISKSLIKYVIFFSFYLRNPQNKN